MNLGDVPQHMSGITNRNYNPSKSGRLHTLWFHLYEGQKHTKLDNVSGNTKNAFKNTFLCGERIKKSKAWLTENSQRVITFGGWRKGHVIKERTDSSKYVVTNSKLSLCSMIYSKIIIERDSEFTNEVAALHFQVLPGRHSCRWVLLLCHVAEWPTDHLSLFQGNICYKSFFG